MSSALAALLVACGGGSPPTLAVSFVTPQEGDFVTGAVLVRVTVDDPARVAAVELRAADERFARLFEPPFEAPFDTTGVADGALTLQAIVVPVDGSATVVTTVSVAVDNSPPLVVVVEPEADARRFIEDGDLHVRAVVADGSGVAEAEIRASAGAELTRQFLSPAAEITADFAWADLAPGGAPPAGPFTVSVRAVDAVGRETLVERAVTGRTRLRWAFDTLGRITRPPLVGADGTIWVGSESGALIHLSADGVELCRFAGNADEPVASAPAQGPGVVLFGTTAALRALDASCAVAWTYPVAGVYYSTPAHDTARSVLYAATYAGDLHALTPAGGNLWTVPVGALEVESSPVVDPVDGTVYIGSFDYRMYAFAPAGSVRWSVPTGREVYGDGVRQGDRLYFGSADRYLYAVSAGSGAAVWPIAFETDGPIRSTPAVAADGTVYVTSQDGNLYAVDATGVERWRLPAGGLDRAGPVVDAGGVVYVGDTAGELHAVGPDGVERWRFTTFGAIQSSGVLAASVLLVGSHDRRLYALDTGAP